MTEHDSTGAVKKKYIYAFGKCIAFVDSANGKHWMHQDAQGSTKLITNASGTAENAYKYYPFGDSLNFTGTVKNDVKYTGQKYADGIEAYDFNARYYDPELGRFYSRDPLGSAASSPYAYCNNDPVNLVDPSGMTCEPADPDMGGMADGGFNGMLSYSVIVKDQWGNITSREYFGNAYGSGGDWSWNVAEPSYMWGSCDVTFDKSVSKSEQDKIMRRKYIESKYGGKEGRDAAAGIHGCTIKYEDLGPADLNNGKKGEYNEATKTITINSQLGSDVNTMALMHESLHGSLYGDAEFLGFSNGIPQYGLYGTPFGPRYNWT